MAGTLSSARLGAGLLCLLLGAGCVPDPAPDQMVEVFDIAADRVDCTGVGPMRCLVVNDGLFYDDIEGYDHVEGQAARICVTKTARPEPLPADIGRYVYKRVPCDRP